VDALCAHVAVDHFKDEYDLVHNLIHRWSHYPR
jgi:hypothetical protein